MGRVFLFDNSAGKSFIVDEAEVEDFIEDYEFPHCLSVILEGDDGK